MATPTLGSVPTTLEDCEATTGWTFTSIALDGDLKKQGSNSVFGIMRNDLAVASWNIITDGGSAQNMTGRHVRCYIWFNSVGLLDIEANNGMEFFMYDGTNTAYWVAFGSDTYEGGWKNYVLDCDSTPDSGSFDKTIVQAWGWRYNRTAAPRNVDNTWIDYLRWGDGYYATGGTSGDEIDLAGIAAQDKANGYGIIEVIEGVYFSFGELTIGNGATTTWFEMLGEVLVFTDSPVASTLYGLLGVGSGCRINIVGSVIRSAGTGDNTRHALDFSDSGVVSLNLSDSFIVRAGLVTFKSGQDVLGSTFTDCGQITPSGADLSGSAVDGYEGTVDTAALIWDVGTDTDGLLDGASFVMGTAATHGIEFEVAGEYLLNDITFSGYGAAESTSAGVLNALTPTTVDSYSESNQDTTQALGNATITAVGQEFAASAGVLNACRFYLSKTLSPTGNIVAELYATDGGSPAEPTGAVLATSEPVSAAGLTGSLVLTQFDFGDGYTLSAATSYFIVLRYSGGDASNYVNVGTDTSSPSHGGNFATEAASTWTGVSGEDACFYLYRDGGVVLNISGGSTPTTKTVTTGASTVVYNPVVHTVNGLATGSQVIWIRQSDEAELENKAEASGVATYAYTYGGDVDVWVQILSLTKRNKLVPVTLGNQDATLPAAQENDTVYSNP
jgi:hypothetical protein